MRRSALVLAAAALLTGCGYIGEPLPPALKRPARITDLAAVERGSNLIIQFTIPRVTTEDLPIRGPQDIELRAGPAGASPFQLSDWERTSDLIPGINQDRPRALVEVPAAKYAGKTVVIAVRSRGPSHTTEGWSNFVTLDVVPALTRPEGLEAKNAPDAIRLDWHAAAPSYRVFRKLPEAADWTLIGTAPMPFYIDSAIDYGKTYQYFVQAVEKTGDTFAESDISETIAFKPADTFPPAVPSGVSAVPGTRSIDLAWERNTERDFAGYRVYRNGVKVADALTAPAYSDRDTQPGVKYRYEVSAFDRAANESARSAPVEAMVP